ncbi:hypothetical protein HELRODRAFT_188962 [Helobdella robusta]|uniref:CARMIL C-terminal domain-containing protein n=1 Tax=Helobdella robusta TaxID=6412 RepID=T1FQI4_HELRO|nr:hypothetical protein HELRODRAFT_188962 [Helobdella robusta]ESN98943.1 hypothetical protein HELRODRAFT_188962 [Helobdella robusta]
MLTGRSHVEKICDALHANKFTLLNSINISKNSLDDKSVQLLCSLNIQWQCLNLAETCIPTGVINTIFGPTNKFQRLTHLDMSKIVFKSSGSQVLLLFLSKPNEVETLVLEYTDVPLENLVVSLKGGCVDHLKTLNLCGTQLSRKKMNELHFNSCKTFLSTAQSLRFVNLSHCHLTPDYLKQVLLGIAVNRNMRNVELKLAGNSLDQRFADVFEVSLPMLSNINSLDISNNNFSVDDLKLIFKKLPQTSNLKKLFVGKNLLNNKTRSLEPFVNALVDYLQDDQATIECLYMEDMSLRSDAYTFINHLGSDVTLLELNIGGNSIGPTGGRLLSKTLQVNNCLQTLMLDKNDLNISALQDIAHGLTRNKTLRNLPLPLHDILAISKNNLERVDKLDAVVKKITSLLQRNNSPTQLLANDQFSKQLLNYDVGETLDKMVVSMEMYVDRLEGTQQLKNQLNETISTAHKLIQESRLFIEIYKDIYDMVQSAAEQKATTNHNKPHHDDNEMLIEKIKIRSPLDTELTKLKTRQDTLDPKFLLTNSTLSGIMKRSVDDINHTSPFALLSMFKNVAFDMANNVEELMDLMLLKEQECHLSSSPMESSMNNNLRFSTLLGKKKDQVSLNNMTDSLFPDFSMKTLKKARPTSILTDLPDLPVTSSSLEHLNLQRPKMMKKHKITLPVITFSDKKYDVVTKLKESSTFSSLSGSKQSVASSQDTDEEYKN